MAGVPSARVRRLLHLPSELAGRLDATELVAELVRRLREVLDAEAVVVEVDEGAGAGPRIVARSGPLPEVGPSANAATVVALPTTAPLRGSLVVRPHDGAPAAPDAADLAELVAHRVAMAVESAWLREVDQRRRAWLAYLADTSELLGQSLDVELTVAVVPQVVVPRLGAWCAVHLVDEAGRLRLAALTHADEDRLPELRAALDGLTRSPELRAGLAGLLAGMSGPVRFGLPTDGVAVPLTSHASTRGTLTVGRPMDRPHSPEDVALIADVARRAALAVHNAQVTAAHVRVSQALQQALLPRALPVVPGLDLAAQYLPASTGSDVGGDFYDVYAVGPAQWLVAIGDVCGTGAGAAARTGLMRDVLRVLVREGRSLVRAIELLNDVMLESGDPLQFATLAAALVTLREAGDGGGHGDPRARGAARAGRAPAAAAGAPRRPGRPARRARHRRRAGRAARPDVHLPRPAPGRDPAALHRRGHRAAPRQTSSSASSGSGGPGARPRGGRRRGCSRWCSPRSTGSPPRRTTTTSRCWPCAPSRRRDGRRRRRTSPGDGGSSRGGRCCSCSPPRAPSPSTRSRCPRLPCSPGSSAPPRWRCSASPRGGWRGR